MNFSQRKNWVNSVSMIKLVCTMMQILCAYKFDIMRCASAFTVSIPWAIWSRRSVSSAPKVSHHRVNSARKINTIKLFTLVSSDMATLTYSDLPTLLGVTTGIAVLAGLICLVLHLFSKNKYPRHRHFNDAHLPPPIMYSSDTGTTHAAEHRLSDQTSFV